MFTKSNPSAVFFDRSRIVTNGRQHPYYRLQVQTIGVYETCREMKKWRWIMKMKKILIGSAMLPALIVLPAHAQQTNPAETPAQVNLESNRPSNLNMETNLLYIIPRDRIRSDLWEQSETEYPREASAEKSAQTIFYIKDFSAVAEEEPFSTLLGSDWIVVPIDEDASLFRLIATQLPEESITLPSLRFDSGRYHLEEMVEEPSWLEGSLPKKIMLKWVEWWHDDSTATPVVLILVYF